MNIRAWRRRTEVTHFLEHCISDFLTGTYIIAVHRFLDICFEECSKIWINLFQFNGTSKVEDIQTTSSPYKQALVSYLYIIYLCIINVAVFHILILHGLLYADHVHLRCWWSMSSLWPIDNNLEWNFGRVTIKDDTDYRNNLFYRKKDF